MVTVWMGFNISVYGDPRRRGWSGGAMVLGKLSVPGRPTYLDKSRARANCACSRSVRVVWTFFSLIYLFSFLSPSLWETARYRLKYCLKGPLNPKQPTNQHPRRNQGRVFVDHKVVKAPVIALLAIPKQQFCFGSFCCIAMSVFDEILFVMLRPAR